MSWLSIEHSRLAYRADIAFYGGAVVALAAWLSLRGPAGTGVDMALMVAAGGVTWSFLEYALHRWVLHGLPPFKAWHREHHQRPAARICTPTLLSATLLVLLVGLPAVWAMGRWLGGGFALGVLVGYLGYTLTHHALHHGSLNWEWLQRRKYQHARHHHLLQPCCFGVTSGFWDWVLHTGGHKDHARMNIPVRRYNG